MDEDDFAQHELRIPYIKLDHIVGSNEYPALIRQTAKWCIDGGYVVMADWLTDIHGDDLRNLIAQADRCYKYGEPSDALRVLGSILVVGEGGELPVTLTEVTQVISRLIMLITAESMSRKGVVKFNRHHATLTTDLDYDKLIQLDLPEGAVMKQPNQAPDIDPNFPKGKPE